MYTANAQTPIKVVLRFIGKRVCWIEDEKRPREDIKTCKTVEEKIPDEHKS